MFFSLSKNISLGAELLFLSAMIFFKYFKFLKKGPFFFWFCWYEKIVISLFDQLYFNLNAQPEIQILDEI